MNALLVDSSGKPQSECADMNLAPRYEEGVLSPPPSQRLTGSPHLALFGYAWLSVQAKANHVVSGHLPHHFPLESRKNHSVPCPHVCGLLRPACCIMSRPCETVLLRQMPGLTPGEEKPQRKRGHCLLSDLSSSFS